MLSLLLLAAPLAAAPSGSNLELLASAPSAAVVNEVIELKPAAGHHFGVEAPQKCGGARALEVTPRRFRCRLDRPGAAPVVASVCDDAKTYCKQARFSVTVTGAAAAAKAAAAHAAPKGGRHGPAGFVSNDPAAALARAKKEGKPLFIHFYGIWCPPCNELEEHAYPAPEFKAAAAGFVLAALDADAPVSFDWKARFKVGGYPTLVVADASLREIGRVVGSRSGAALAKFLGEMAALKDRPVEAVATAVAKGGGTPEERLRVARWRAERAEFEEVERLLAGRTDPAGRRALLDAREEAARRAGDAPARLAVVKALLKDFPDSADFTRWAALVADEDKAAGAALRQAVRSSVEVWSASPALGEAGWSAGDLLGEEAGFIAAVESTVAARPFWLKAAAAHEAQAATSPLGAAARAANFGRAYALGKAGEHAAAAALLESLVKAYPEEFTFHYEYAYALQETGEYAKAYPSAVKAWENGYGDNWLRATRLKALLELKLGRPADAAKTVDDALSETALPPTTEVRSYRYVIALRALREEIAKKL
ncbi:MAG: thioredoxin family protein [Elusimicrobiota bacterium]|nr:thioredoxin family protein [Elusimicrobiota bacterium]